jgi:light-regulated signal transduction histidine kinase (bacteriophytochrome)
MTTPRSVDLTDCDREPIHIPGSIQPHGAMLVCNPATGTVTHASANSSAFFLAPASLVGSSLATIFGEQVAHDLRNASARSGGAEVHGLLMDVNVPGLSDVVDASIHEHEGRLFIEVQPVAQSGGTARDAFDITHALVLRLGRESRVEAIVATGAKLIRAMLDYDRVMVYRLLHNGAGRVIAEAKKADLVSFMGQHFPASDIPQQARRLYLLNTIRAISDVRYAPSPILPPLGEQEAPIDMSFVHLRSVSPIHCEYLHNMGVAASMSISIIVDGELWGMIACHHDAPKTVSMPLRIGAELFGRYFSLQIALAESRAQTVAAAAARIVLDEIVASFSPDESVSEVLLARLERLAAMLPCDGAGIWIDGRWDYIGSVPSRAELDDVFELVNRTAQGRVWESHDLRSHLGRAKTYGTAVAGVLAIPISSAPRDYLLLFRSEEAHNIEWAGEPTKTVVVSGLGSRLTPRGSFEVWREEVRGRAQPWLPAERATAETIRDYLRDVVLRSKEFTVDEHGRAEQRRRVLNDELNHRVKNIIALVKSIAAQTGAHAMSVDGYAAALEGRLRALAFAHDQSLGAQSGDLSTLVEAEAGLHRYASSPERVLAAGPAIGLNDRAFSVLALVIHEMMTNAAKYGALSIPEGRLTLSWSLTLSGDCVLEWLETAGPPVSPPTREGFGGKLIRSTIAYELSGAVSIEHRPTGLWARFTIPAACLVEAVAGEHAPIASDVVGEFLVGLDVLVLEDQSLIAMDLEDTLRRLGAVEVRCAPNIREAHRALQLRLPDWAILDFNLGDHTSAVIADELIGRGVRFVFATGYGDSVMIPERFSAIPVLRKPINAAMVFEAFNRPTAATISPLSHA